MTDPKPITKLSERRANAAIRSALHEPFVGPGYSERTCGSASSSDDGLSELSEETMQATLLEAIADLAAHWGQGDRGLEAEVLHGVADELLGLESRLDPSEWPVYFAARELVQVILDRDPS